MSVIGVVEQHASRASRSRSIRVCHCDAPTAATATSAPSKATRERGRLIGALSCPLRCVDFHTDLGVGVGVGVDSDNQLAWLGLAGASMNASTPLTPKGPSEVALWLAGAGVAWRGVGDLRCLP